MEKHSYMANENGISIVYENGDTFLFRFINEEWEAILHFNNGSVIQKVKGIERIKVATNVEVDY